MRCKKTGRIPFPHPGENIRENHLKPLSMSVNNLALELRVPATRMTELVNGRRGITADTPLRLARYFKTTANFWLQTSYDLAKASESSLSEIERSVQPREVA
jgi:addiction module HigA family antidote